MVDTCNKLLKSAMLTFQAEATRLGEQCLDYALATAEKVMKMKLTKAKLKFAAKIILIATCILIVAAAGVAASVVTGGALAPIIIGGLIAGGTAAWQIYKAANEHWPSLDNTIKAIRADMEAMSTAKDKFEKAINDKKKYRQEPTKVEQAKLLWAAANASVGNLKKHVGQMDKFIVDLRNKLKADVGKLQELANKAAQIPSQSKDPKVLAAAKKLDQEVGRVQMAIDKANSKFDEFQTVKAEAEKLAKAYQEASNTDDSKLAAALTKIQEAKPYIDLMIDAGKSIKDLVETIKG
jgi:chromosome segregation ATPase